MPVKQEIKDLIVHIGILHIFPANVLIIGDNEIIQSNNKPLITAMEMKFISVQNESGISY
jgi:hypothetical protein